MPLNRDLVPSLLKQLNLFGVHHAEQFVLGNVENALDFVSVESCLFELLMLHKFELIAEVRRVGVLGRAERNDADRFGALPRGADEGRLGGEL